MQRDPLSPQPLRYLRFPRVLRVSAPGFVTITGMHRTAALCILAATLCLAVVEARQRAGGAGASGRGVQPANSIHGIVVDKAGRGVPWVYVTALRPDPVDGREFQIVSPRITDLTGTDGLFRLHNVPIGDYYVVAIPRNVERHNDGTSNRSGFATTFFPNAPSIATAKLASVTLSAPAPAVAIVLRPAPLVYVSGHVIGYDGKPPVSGRVLIEQDRLSGVGTLSVPLMRDGSFEAAALAPGTYLFTYRVPAVTPAGMAPLISQAKVVIGRTGKDISDVRVLPETARAR